MVWLRMTAAQVASEFRKFGSNFADLAQWVEANRIDGPAVQWVRDLIMKNARVQAAARLTCLGLYDPVNHEQFITVAVTKT